MCQKQWTLPMKTGQGWIKTISYENQFYSLKLSLPPIWIYILSDAQLSSPIVWYIQKCMLIRKICFYLVLSLRFVHQTKKDMSCYAWSIHWKEALVPRQFSTCVILSHTMTGNRLKVVERDWQKYRLSKESARSESSVIVCERIARVENCPSARAPFPWIGRA